MKAIVRDRYGSPDLVHLTDLPTPVPEGGEALVRVKAASVNTADLDQLRGRPPAIRLFSGLTRPKVRRLGLDIAGIVEAVGEDVADLKPGDAVWADMFPAGTGAFAEYVCARADVFKPMPGHLGFDVAATIPHSASLALQALRARAGVKPRDRVLIVGAGGCVGPFAIQIAKAYGAVVTAVDDTSKLDFMSRAGADHVVDYTKEKVTRNGEQYDFIVDIAARTSVFSYRRSLASGGVFVQVSRTLAGFFSAAVQGELATLASDKKMGVFFWEPNRRADLDELGRLMEQGALVPIIDRRYPLAAVADALRHKEQGLAQGKPVIEIDLP
ncbi:MAG TPA: NAD(P)-dependent alcohol dehydrogenase [Acidimicrobiia bacterium]|jgi:NADPH:quinone reductase-like Zn-dependent oxidoreductase|nr:NAD(P)-dependent alcohol dehydrogenase [Acidimicrobiia bacterium]